MASFSDDDEEFDLTKPWITPKLDEEGWHINSGSWSQKREALARFKLSFHEVSAEKIADMKRW
jgi:hypothetical protein